MRARQPADIPRQLHRIRRAAHLAPPRTSPAEAAQSIRHTSIAGSGRRSRTAGRSYRGRSPIPARRSAPAWPCPPCRRADWSRSVRYPRPAARRNSGTGLRPAAEQPQRPGPPTLVEEPVGLRQDLMPAQRLGVERQGIDALGHLHRAGVEAPGAVVPLDRQAVDMALGVGGEVEGTSGGEGPVQKLAARVIAWRLSSKRSKAAILPAVMVSRSRGKGGRSDRNRPRLQPSRRTGRSRA